LHQILVFNPCQIKVIQVFLKISYCISFHFHIKYILYIIKLEIFYEKKITL
jgi:hypothetical protein